MFRRKYCWAAGEQCHLGSTVPWLSWWSWRDKQVHWSTGRGKLHPICLKCQQIPVVLGLYCRGLGFCCRGNSWAMPEPHNWNICFRSSKCVFCREKFVCKNFFVNLLACLFECLAKVGAEQTCVKHLHSAGALHRAVWALGRWALCTLCSLLALFY